MSAYLVREDAAGRFDLDGTPPLVAGRAPDNHILLHAASVARRHAAFEPVHEGAGWRVVDYGSANGTFVNGVRVEDGELTHGDEVLLGEVALRYLQDDLAVVGRCGAHLLCAPFDPQWCRAIDVDSARLSSWWLPGGAAGGADEAAGVAFSAVLLQWRRRGETPEPTLVDVVGDRDDVWLTFDGRVVRLLGGEVLLLSAQMGPFVAALVRELFPHLAAWDAAFRERVTVDDLRALHAAAPVWPNKKRGR